MQAGRGARRAALMLGAVVAAVSSAAGAACPPRYEVTAIIEGPDCGEPWGTAHIAPWGMNDRGDVVGWFCCTVGYDHAFVWYNEGDGEGTFVEIPMPPGEYYSRAYDINNDRYVTGWAEITGSGYGLSGFLYDGQDTTIIEPLPGEIGAEPQAINDNLDIVGTCGGDRAFLYRDQAMIDLGPKLPGEKSEGCDCNDQGVVSGWSGPTQFEARAFLLDGHAVTEFGPIPGGVSSEANALNNLGQFCGQGLLLEQGDYVLHALYWNGLEMIDLGVLPGRNFSHGRDLNDAGIVVGDSTVGCCNQGLAFVWSDGIMWDLNKLTETGDIGLYYARAINASGQVLCQGAICGQPVGVVLGRLEYLCGDVDGDGSVGVLDLLIVLSEWGKDGSCADLNLDGIVDAVDLLLVLEHWGSK